MSIQTTEVGAQLYSANYLNSTVVGKNNTKYEARQGICIETGQMPNAPAEPSFETVLVTPSAPFYSKTVFSFSAH
jgi:aldose 1-epimerase